MWNEHGTYHHFAYSGVFVDIPFHQIPLQGCIRHRFDLYGQHQSSLSMLHRSPTAHCSPACPTDLHEARDKTYHTPVEPIKHAFKVVVIPCPSPEA